MKVNYFMTKDVVTVPKSAGINEVIELMKQHDIHRIPVVENGKLVGLVTEGTIQEAMPSKATSLSVYEVNYLINKTNAEDVMIRDVKVVGPDEMLETAIAKMRNGSINVLPVVDGDQLVGIITNNDIFDAFLNVSGYNSDGARVSISITEDHKGVLARISNVLVANEISIIQIVVYRGKNKNSPIIEIQVDSNDVTKIEKIFTQEGFNVISCVATEASPEKE